MASTERTELPAGTEFDGRYKIVRRIGGGGMGNVYLADEPRLGRQCALKVLHVGLARQREHVERFLREAQMMARLSHPNIVGIFAFGEAPEGVYFAMELLDGEDLQARVKQRDARPYALDECLVWTVETARAMGVVHKAGLIHRDLKTSNVFLARQGEQEVVKLLDFGIARPAEGSDLTRTGVSLGTPSYMSPEQILDSSLDHRTDIYSLGVVLFKLLTGRTPFQGTPLEITTQHCTVPPPRPSVLAATGDIPRELDEIVLKAMAKSPGNRFASMAAFEQALLTVLSEEQPTTALRSAAPRPAGGVDEATGLDLTGAGALATPPPAGRRAPGAALVLVTVAAIAACVLVAVLALL